MQETTDTTNLVLLQGFIWFIAVFLALVIFYSVKYALRSREQWTVRGVENPQATYTHIGSYYDSKASTPTKLQWAHMLKGEGGFLTIYSSITLDQIQSSDYTRSYYRPLSNPLVKRRTLALEIVPGTRRGRKTWVRIKCPSRKERWFNNVSVPTAEGYTARETKSDSDTYVSEDSLNVKPEDFVWDHPRYRLVPDGLRKFKYIGIKCKFWQIEVDKESQKPRKRGKDEDAIIDWLDPLEFTEKYSDTDHYIFDEDFPLTIFDEDDKVHFIERSWTEEKYREFCQEAPGQMAAFEEEIIGLNQEIDNISQDLAKEKQKTAINASKFAMKLKEHEEQIVATHAAAERKCFDCFARCTDIKDYKIFLTMLKQHLEDVADREAVRRVKELELQQKIPKQLSLPERISHASKEDKRKAAKLLTIELDGEEYEMEIQQNAEA